MQRLLAPGVRVILAALMALPLLLPQTPAVEAHHGGREISSLLQCERPNVSPPRCTSVGNNLLHLVAFHASLTEELRAAMRKTMADDYDATDLIVREHETVNAATDVIAFSGDYGENGAAGWVYCPNEARQGVNAHGHRWCVGQELHFNINPRYSVFFDDEASREHVACHEMGHTIGLRHWGNPPETEGPVAATCMNGNTPNGPTDLHQIDIDHINAYGYGMRRAARGFTARAFGDPLPKTISFWTGGGVDAIELEHHPSLEALTAGADAVVLGRIATVRAGRVFGDPHGNELHYAALTVEVEDVLAGSLERSLVTVEVPLWEGPDALDDVRDAVPAGEAVLFLRSKATSARAAGVGADVVRREAEFHRLVEFGAAIANEDGRAVPGDATALGDLNGEPFADVLRAVRRSAAGAASGSTAR